MQGLESEDKQLMSVARERRKGTSVMGFKKKADMMKVIDQENDLCSSIWNRYKAKQDYIHQGQRTECCCNSGVSKIWPAGWIQPMEPIYVACQTTSVAVGSGLPQNLEPSSPDRYDGQQQEGK